jgi:hypothetical protein
MTVDTGVSTKRTAIKDKMTALLIAVPLVAVQGAWVGFLVWIFIRIV